MVTTPQAVVRSLLPLAVAVGVAVGLELLLGLLGFYAQKILFDIGVNIILAVSLNMVNGFTGQFSIGHAGFMALGAYGSIVVTYYGGYALFGDVMMHSTVTGYALYFVSILVGGVVAAGAGLLVGLPSLRLRGDYLAIVTLGFGEIIRVVLQVSQPVLEPSEMAAVPWYEQPWHLGRSLGFVHSGSYNTLGWTWTAVAVTLLVAYRLRESTHGRAFLSIRENEIAAESIGVNTTRYKVNAFVLAAFFAGVAGSLFGHQLGAGTASRPEEFNFMKSFEVIIMVVLGGMGSISGAAVAAVALTLLTEALRSFQDYRMISYSLLLVIVMILRPQGLFGTHEIWHLLARFRRKGTR
ncbi:MAG: branched-chain amino acid ABC transporter permease [Myxococcales bacterium]|nr:branched-chain amino acid ABC transporter permease [Myxococcales bacterium]